MRPIQPKSQFGEWLNGELSRRGMTIESLAKSLRMSRVAISYHINGQRRPTTGMLERYACFFGEDWVYLYQLVYQDRLDERLRKAELHMEKESLYRV